MGSSSEKQNKAKRNTESSFLSSSLLIPFLLRTIFPALLPPSDAEDYEYYAVLELESSCSAADIRKAYKKQSLKYHPDKNPSVQAADHYQRVQAAYTVLSDPHERQVYTTGWQRSVARYQQAKDGGSSLLQHPHDTVRHLQAASCTAKTRLFLVVVVFVLAVVVWQPVWIAVRVEQQGNTDASSWMIVWIPLWIVMVGGILGLGYAAVFAVDCGTLLSFQLGTQCFEWICWWCGALLVAYQWDHASQDQLPWHGVAVPFYMAMVLHVLGGVLHYYGIRFTQAKMVSEDYYTKHIQKRDDGINEKRETDEDEDDEGIDGATDPYNDKDYIVITTDHDTVAQVLGLFQADQENASPPTDEEVEAMRVHTSPEFQAAEVAAWNQQWKLGAWLATYVPLMVLMVGNVANNWGLSWWIVFIPLWLRLGLPLVYNMFVCCCVGPLNDDDDGDDDDGDDDDDDDKDKGEDADTTGQTGSQMFQPIDGDLEELEAQPFPPGASKDSLRPESPIATEQDPTTPPVRPPNNTNAPRGSNDNFFERGNVTDDDDAVDPEFLDAKIKSMGTCCGLTVQLGLLCLVVARLQDPDAFRAIWIVFPAFCFVGVVLCLCCCCIYMPQLPDDSEPSNEDDLFVYKMDTPVRGTGLDVEAHEGTVGGDPSPTVAAESSETKDPPHDDGDPTTSSMDDLD